jgi:N-acylneuraminate cytidylyltransferase
MYREKRILGLITARGGSKGVPGKNIRALGGKPLIAWTIEAAGSSAYIDEVVVSTDCARIAEVARSCGCTVPFIRPAELATDAATSVDVVRHAIANSDGGFEIIVLLQPTSPLRTAHDIDACIRLCIKQGGASVVSVAPVDKSPYWMFHLNEDRVMHPFLSPDGVDWRRQDCPPLYALNGAVYVFTVARFLEVNRFVDTTTRGYVMPADRSIDIDTELDFAVCEKMVEGTP